MPDPTAPDAGGHASNVIVRTDDAVGAGEQQRDKAAREHGPALSEHARVQAREIVARYPRPRSALLPMLHLVQAEQGYITADGVAMCAEELGLSKAEVGAVATFYTMYKRHPTGEYLISVCTNTLCGVLGGEEIYQALSEFLGVGHDQTTADGTITLEHAECLAACDYAPVVTVNYEFYDQQDTDSAMTLVRALQEGKRPHPTRGAPLCSFREMSRQLAGFFDPVADAEAVAGHSAGEPTLAGNRLAVARGDESPAFDADTPIPSAARSGRASTVEPQPQPQPKPEPKPPAAAEAVSSTGTTADPEPSGGDTAEKAFSERAERQADSPAEQAGAESADPDAAEDIRDAPESDPAPPSDPKAGQAPTARRHRSRRARSQPENEA